MKLISAGNRQFRVIVNSDRVIIYYKGKRKSFSKKSIVASQILFDGTIEVKDYTGVFYPSRALITRLSSTGVVIDSIWIEL